MILFAVTWGSGLKVADNNRLSKLIRRAGDVVGEELDTLTTVAERRMLSRLQSILDNVSHPLYDTLPSRGAPSAEDPSPRCTTERHRKSFLPVVINLYNASSPKRVRHNSDNLCNSDSNIDNHSFAH